MEDPVVKLFNYIREGLSGENRGVDTGIEKWDKSLGGIKKQTLYLIGADTGCGKSSFVLFYIYRLLMWQQQQEKKQDNEQDGEQNTDQDAEQHTEPPKVHILFFNLEMAAEMLLAKLLSLYIYENYSVIISVEQMLSSTQKKLAPWQVKLINKCAKWLTNARKRITFVSYAGDEIAVEQQLRKFYSPYGTFSTDEEGNMVYTRKKGLKDLFFAVVDHVGLLKGSKEQKDNIAIVFKTFRNATGLTTFMVQQLNRNLKSVERKKAGLKYVQLDDFKGTGAFCDIAEIVIAIYYPQRENDDDFFNYNMSIKPFAARLRLLQILKNRYGECDTCLPVMFYGECNLFKSVPESHLMDPYSWINLPEKDADLLNLN
jgi:replicative DNA helicase